MWLLLWKLVRESKSFLIIYLSTVQYISLSPAKCLQTHGFITSTGLPGPQLIVSQHVPINAFFFFFFKAGLFVLDDHLDPGWQIAEFPFKTIETPAESANTTLKCGHCYRSFFKETPYRLHGVESVMVQTAVFTLQNLKNTSRPKVNIESGLLEFPVATAVNCLAGTTKAAEIFRELLSMFTCVCKCLRWFMFNLSFWESCRRLVVRVLIVVLLRCCISQMCTTEVVNEMWC